MDAAVSGRWRGSSGRGTGACWRLGYEPAPSGPQCASGRLGVDMALAMLAGCEERALSGPGMGRDQACPC